MIKLKNLSKNFGTKKIFDNVTCDIKESETLAVIGPSGCGKSTLLRLLILLEQPTSGKIYIKDKDISLLDEDQLVTMRESIGFVFQSSALFDSLTVGENVAFGLREHTNKSDREIKRIIAQKLEMVELKGTEDMMPSELSGGMQKRVSLARAIAMDPKIILYDEPTTGLDPITSTAIEDLMNKLAKELKVTSIVVTHQLSTIFRTANRIVMMHEAKFIDNGTVEETKRSKNPVIRDFITGGLEGGKK